MYEVIARYLIGLLVGVCLGLAFPFLASWWLVLGSVVAIIVVQEMWGQWGFGDRWPDYRFSVYLLYAGVAVCALTGILLGSGALGRMLIAIGKLIS